jgi:hypothetical protein
MHRTIDAGSQPGKFKPNLVLTGSTLYIAEKRPTRNNAVPGWGYFRSSALEQALSGEREFSAKRDNPSAASRMGTPWPAAINEGP